MPTSSCKLFNDSTQPVQVRTYNYSDSVHWICHSSYQIGPGERKTVEAAHDDSGLQVKVGDSEPYVAKTAATTTYPTSCPPRTANGEDEAISEGAASEGLRHTIVGGNDEITFRHDAGGVLTRVAVWRFAGGCIGRMEFWFADGTSKAIGGEEAESTECKTLELGVGEYVKTLVMWSGQCNDHADYGTATLFTGIEIETSGDQRLEAVVTDHCVAHVVEVASGFVVGITGRSGSMIESLGLVFLDTIETIGMTIDGDNSPAPSETAAEVEHVLENKTNSEEQHELKFNWVERKSVSLQVTKGTLVCHGWNARVQVNFDVGVAKVEGEVGYKGFDQTASETTNGSDSVTETQKTHTLRVVVPPQSRSIIRYRDGTISTSTYRSGRWVVGTSSGVREYAFRGLFSMYKTFRHYTHSEQPLSNACEAA
ncbi:natterin-like protein [Phytophthora cinnamomi]|uniref:natterin-like protein n=1 Tax=Phytophthora cinnamomi TaxID=4785 RepID=UPI00355977F3|nr:natterin-like protein [Phytophthora cinnamomi]